MRSITAPYAACAGGLYAPAPWWDVYDVDVGGKWGGEVRLGHQVHQEPG